MRRGGLTLLAVAVLAIAGCGSSSSPSSTPSGARATELSYFPPGSPFIATVATAPGSPQVKGIQSLLNHFPVVSFGEAAIFAKLRQIGIDYQSDIRPLFGNPVMIGAAGATLTSGSSVTGAATSNFLIVWVTKSADKLNALVHKIPGLSPSGSHDGAKLFQLGLSSTMAITGATLIFGPTMSEVSAALDRHAHGGGFSAGEAAQLTSGLPSNTLFEGWGDLTGVLSRGSAAKARKVPWVAALRGYGVSLSASSTGISLQYRLDTSGGSLTSAQLPLAPGSSTPSFAGSLPITVGVSDPAHIVKFVEGAEQIVSPSSWAKFTKRQAAVKARTGYDLDSLVSQLTGNLIIASDTHTTLGRVGVSSASTASKIVAALVSDPRAVFNKATNARNLGGGFYSLTEGHSTITLGVVGNQLVVGKASVAALKSFAAAPTTPATGAQGSVAFRVALVQLLQHRLSTLPGFVKTLFSSLGDITGSTQESPAALTGNATLALK